MKNSDALKKHHFWILFGLVPLFVMIAVLVVGSSVASDISKRETEIKNKESAIKAKANPKPAVLIEKMDEMIKYINSKQDGLWRGGFNPQKNLYTFLDSPALKDIEALNLRFGDKIPEKNGFEYEEFKKKEYYQKRFEKMAEHVEPTHFAGGWQSVLRYVNPWSDVKLTSPQIWLLMEDIWVQESLLSAIASVNEQMAEFSRIKFEKNGQVIDDPEDKTKAHSDPLRRKFKSRTWEVELEVVTEGTKQYLRGTLINTTDRLQLMGVGNTMTLKVWLSPGDRNAVQPFELKIGKEYLPGVGAVAKDKDGKILLDKDGKTIPANVLEIRSEENAIPTGMPVQEISYVEQAFDGRTVPIKEIRNLALGVADSRHGLDYQLKSPVGGMFKEDAPPAAGIPTSAAPGGKPMLSGPGTSMSGGPNQNASAQRIVSGPGTVQGVIDGNKNRYIAVSEQVRRMPVGIAVVVDEDYMQDVLIAFANSPLRFQITQVTWNRFRGTLESGKDQGPTASKPGSSNGQVVMSGQSHFGSDFTGPGSKPRPGAMSPSMPGPGPGRGPGSPSRPGSGGPMTPGNMQPGSSYGYGASAGTVSESQLTSGLIELRIFGIVSLYTSPDAPPPEPKKDATAKKDADPKDKTPATKDQKDTKAPKDSKDAKESKEPKEPKETKNPKDANESMPKGPMTPESQAPKK